MKKLLKDSSYSLIPAVILIGLLEALVNYKVLDAYIFPAPSSVGQSLLNDSAEFFTAFQQTIFAALLGFAISALLGILLAILLSFSRFLEKAFYPYATFFQTVPIVSVAPLLVIWFGFGFRTVVISAMIVSIFPIIANTLAGLKYTDPSLLDLFYLYKSNSWQTLVKLKIPSAVPHIMIGLKISAGLSMIGAVIGEFIAGGGLGGIIDSARTQQRVDKVFAAILLTSLAGILLVTFLNLFSRLFLKRWRHFNEN